MAYAHGSEMLGATVGHVGNASGSFGRGSSVFDDLVIPEGVEQVATELNL